MHWIGDVLHERPLVRLNVNISLALYVLIK